MVCSKGKCCCGKTIEFRSINGRVVPIHIKK